MDVVNGRSLEWALIQSDWHSSKKGKYGLGDVHTGRTPRKNGSRDWADASRRQRTSDIVSKPPEAKGEAGNRFSLWPSEGTNPTHTLISDFWPPNSETTHSRCLSHPLCDVPS